MGFVGLGGEVVEEGLEKVGLTHSESSGGAVAEPRQREVLNAHERCPVGAVVGKKVDDSGLEVAAVRQMAYAPLGKEVELQTLVSTPFPHPPAF